MGKIQTVGMLICLGSLFFLAACDTGSAPAPLTATTASPSSPALSDTVPQDATPAGSDAADPTPTPFPYDIKDDVQFIDMMVPHHQLAIDMAHVAQDHAQHGEVKGLARDIIRSQQDEINRLLYWRQQITGVAITPGAMDHSTMSNMPGMNVDLTALAASRDFDKAFITAMLPHHRSAIDMSKAALPNLKRKEVHDMAQDIINFQQLEIDLMNGWLKAWYK